MISNTTFRIMVIADSCSGTKLESTIPRPEILLTDVWLGTRKKYTAAAGKIKWKSDEPPENPFSALSSAAKSLVAYPQA